MSLSHHQQHQLYRIEAGLLRADPELAAMLAIFGKLSAGQAMPSWEQVPARRDRIRQAATLTAEAITFLAAAIGFLLSAILAAQRRGAEQSSPAATAHPPGRVMRLAKSR